MDEVSHDPKVCSILGDTACQKLYCASVILA